jgi:Taurine catabolism dioxygenase TauD, TfdA family
MHYTMSRLTASTRWMGWLRIQQGATRPRIAQWAASSSSWPQVFTGGLTTTLRSYHAVSIQSARDFSQIAAPVTSVAQDSDVSSQDWSTRKSKYHVNVSSDGQRVTIDGIVAAEGNSTESASVPTATTFDAIWLWTNDPNHVHTTSGQRTRSPNTFFSSEPKILSAELIHISHHKPMTDAIQFPKVPPKGSLHPIGGVYGVGSDTENSRIWLRVDWTSSCSATVAANQENNVSSSYFNMQWLLQCRYNVNQSTGIPRPNDDATVVLQAGDALDSVPFHRLATVAPREDFVLDDRNVAKMTLLDAVWHRGAGLVSQAPTVDNDGTAHSQDEATNDTNDDTVPVARVAKTLSGGRLSHGHLYGDVFAVQSVSYAHNIAFTSEALAPHQDFPYYVSPPGLQLLHCVAFDPNLVRGGESFLIDVVAAAREFKRLAPSLFDVLVQCEATFVKQRVGADLVYRRPHIQLDASGSHVVSVRWSPPFEGPLAVAPHLVTDYYVAYTAFERMLDNSFPRLSSPVTGTKSSSPRNRLLPKLSWELESALCDYAHTFTWERHLEPGEILVFNNQRMLHGRRAFSVVETSRSVNESRPHRLLMGCYTSMDDTLSEYRVLRRERYRDSNTLPPIPFVGNGNTSLQ